jgi:protein Tex
MSETTPDKPAAPSTFDPVPPIAAELGLPPAAVHAVVDLLADGNTVPFIARYRKERTGGLDEVQIRTIEERRGYLLELDDRRTTVLASIREQGKLTDDLEARICAATTKAALEDLYLPYKPRRRTRAAIARDKGLEPLARRILEQAADGDPVAEAEAFVRTADSGVEADHQVASAADALAGARDIVAEHVAETAEVRAFVRGVFADEGELVSEAVPTRTGEPTKFEQYYQFREAVKTVPSHRFLAIRRGEAEGVLRAQIAVDHDKVIAGIERLVHLEPASPWAAPLREAIADAHKRLLVPSVENDLRVELKLRSDAAAVDVFADNLRNLLLSAPLGARAVIGIDPGLRTGCKCAAVDATGKFLGATTIFITQGEAQQAKARDELVGFLGRFTPVAIAVGNGTGGREAEGFVRRVLAEAQLADRFVVSVNEAGASVYSASDVARDEFPDLDLTIRGAISIARRLQDPLSELVKVEPKAIGVGQYQHDVHQPLLARKLGDVVESCVNHVGVELNTASAQLLSYVAGIGKALAKKIVVHREHHGAFQSRRQLLDVTGLGPKAFEQAAGFLRIRGGVHPLDASAVHPERYALVERMAADLGVAVGALVGNQELVDKIDLSRYVSDDVGEPTLRDIVAELVKPGRDPRAEFEPPKFRDDVTTLADLKPGMALEGVVTNVTAFGAFVDVGVHQDGLIHVSQLADRFVKDPSEVVKVGDKLKVRVLEVDLQRRRIALTARSENAPPKAKRGEPRPDRRGEPRQGRPPRGQGQGQPPGQGQPQGQGQPPGQGQPRGQGRRPQQGGQGQGGQGQGPGPGGQGQRRRDDRRRGDRRPDDRRPDEAPAQQAGGAPSGDRPGKGGKEQEQGYGISGFVNNPFAKLADLNNKR